MLTITPPMQYFKEDDSDVPLSIVLSVLLQFMDTFLALVTFYQYLNNRMEISVTFWNTWFRHLEGIAIIFLKILHRWRNGKSGDELRCSGRVSSSCSTSDIIVMRVFASLLLPLTFRTSMVPSFLMQGTAYPSGAPEFIPGF
jgi:hypothetical protein